MELKIGESVKGEEGKLTKEESWNTLKNRRTEKTISPRSVILIDSYSLSPPE